MDLDIVLFWLALFFIAGTFIASRGRGGWAAVSGLLLVLAPVLLLLCPVQAPWIVLGLWVALILAPALLARVAIAQSRRENFRAARLASLAAALLHPLDGWPGRARLLAALGLAHRGALDEARVILADLARAPSPIGLNARSHLCRLDMDWRPLLSDPRLTHDDPSTILTRVRALGECGHVEEMLGRFAAHQTQLRQIAPGPVQQVLVPVLAFGGRPLAVAALYERSLGDVPVETARLWTAIAQAAAGGEAARRGMATLQALSSSEQPGTSRAAQGRLASPPRVAASLDRDSSALLDAIEDSFVPPPNPKARRRPRRNIVTLALIALNLAVFALEYFWGGTESDTTLYAMGGLFVPTVLQDGAWWRLVAALFLHAGPIHLGSNMLGLYILGAVIEPLLGRRQFLLLYAVAGVGSNAIIVLLTWWGAMQPNLLVGASGAIMGLIGGFGAGVAREWLTTRSPQALQRLARVVVALVLQTGIDLTTPRISLSAHIAGAASGFLVGCCLCFCWPSPVGLPPLAAAPKSGVAPARRGLLQREWILYGIVAGAIGASLLIAAHR